MKKSLKIIIFLVVIVVVAFAVLLSYHKFKKIEWRASDSETSTVAIVPVNISTISRAIENTFNPGKDAYNYPSAINRFSQNNKLHYFYLFSSRSIDEPNGRFPVDSVLAQYAETENSSTLKEYVSLNPNLRKNDYYLAYFGLENLGLGGNSYWYSEYYYQGQPAKFKTDFLIHLESFGDSSTKVKIFEVTPTIIVGQRFELFGHAIVSPHFGEDRRIVAPTISDRVELLDKIRQAVQFSR